MKKKNHGWKNTKTKVVVRPVDEEDNEVVVSMCPMKDNFNSYSSNTTKSRIRRATSVPRLYRTAHILFYAECSSPSTPTLPIHYSNLCNLSHSVSLFPIYSRRTRPHAGADRLLRRRFRSLEKETHSVDTVTTTLEGPTSLKQRSKQKASLEKEIHHTVSRKIRRKVDDEINNRLSLGTLFFQPNFLVTVEILEDAPKVLDLRLATL
ncbi:hypothetical protein YC2023_049456 [Brassica napus]